MSVRTTGVVRFRFETKSLQTKPTPPQSAAKRPDDPMDVVSYIFGFSHVEKQNMIRAGGAVITCLPVQFVEFLVWRRDAGYTNGFAVLNVELLESAKAAPALPMFTAKGV